MGVGVWRLTGRVRWDWRAPTFYAVHATALAWSQLNRTTPDARAAEEAARQALALVPHWRYVRDILIPQVQAAKQKK